ncbi:sulfotransferase 1C2-like [Limulus polyphemus]|uniref:Sulfotransferase 1C2-like n=1 Tax=Limulus polyphemus TaxID=6850 RepID=A0ABM1C4R5_LIMPO|nr:sulfotransferase 1C2-like [Limulus polyphemus]
MSQQRKNPTYQEVDGFTINITFSPECVRGAIQYKPRDDDIFVVTFPKCGTTWTQHIVHNILNKGETFKSFDDVQKRSPFIEMVGPKIVKNMIRPGAIKTHLPFHMCPYSPNAKYIYVTRNPRDCCVSFYHHTKMFPGYQFQGGSFDDFFEVFINGETEWGDYFDHLLSGYEHKNDPNVCFITYEEMKEDTKAAVLKLAKFLGPQYGDTLESDDEIMLKILDHTSIKFMKRFNEDMKLFYSNTDETNLNGTESLKVDFVRKGAVGDWKNYFSPVQSKRLMEKFYTKTKGTDIFSLWDKLFQD